MPSVLVEAVPTGLVLAVLGDSVGVGIGDPALGGGWRGFGPLLAEALGGARLTNLAVSGSRVGGVLERQLPAALAARPDVVVLVVGMNDTMRSDFDPRRLHADLDHVVGALVAVGSTVITAKYHEHHRVFRLPGPIRRALASRIGALNEILDIIGERHGIGVLDLGAVPGIYDPRAWAVDRLHPSELGHRLLARAIAGQLAARGTTVHSEVSLQCAGGRHPGRIARWGWLLFKGLPWLVRRGRDLVPYALSTFVRRG
ncbi:SGNH/GDSL hydrolase family protein [Actinophytocola sp.]|uniref:SGNH/GDSL hydrolase family protein n=1 Tax=Actinophytocola sp. TaxID=1872138 RepID=UPI00389ACBAD